MSRKPTNIYAVYRAGTRGIRVCRDDSISLLFIEPALVLDRGLSWNEAQRTAQELRQKRGREKREALDHAANRRRAKKAALAERVMALSPGVRVERIATGVIGEIIATPTAGPVRTHPGTVLVRFPRRIEELPAHLLRPR